MTVHTPLKMTAEGPRPDMDRIVVRSSGTTGDATGAATAGRTLAGDIVRDQHRCGQVPGV